MKFTYYTIIGKDKALLEGHVKNVKEYAGFDKLTCEKEFVVIIYRNKNIPDHITNELFNFCTNNNLTVKFYDEPTTSFIDNLYACWNLGYEVSDNGYVFRGGSDQVFSKDSFVALYDAAQSLNIIDNKIILQANTIENETRLKQINAISRHFVKDFGVSFQEFDFNSFESFISEINLSIDKPVLDINDCLQYWGKPTKLQTSLGNIDRVDGCSWLMSKEDWVKYGPMPTIQRGITGDVIIHDVLQKAGYKELIVKDCVTYHFVRGESGNW